MPRLLESLPEAVNLVTIDASFISLKLLLPVVKGWFFAPGQGEGKGKQGSNSPSEVIALVKPQFEAGRKEAARGKGVIRDPAVHQAVLKDIMAFAEAQGFSLLGQIQSPVVGPKGNIEFLVWLEYFHHITKELTWNHPRRILLHVSS